MEYTLIHTRNDRNALVHLALSSPSSRQSPDTEKKFSNMLLHVPRNISRKHVMRVLALRRHAAWPSAALATMPWPECQWQMRNAHRAYKIPIPNHVERRWQIGQVKSAGVRVGHGPQFAKWLPRDMAASFAFVSLQHQHLRLPISTSTDLLPLGA